MSELGSEGDPGMDAACPSCGHRPWPDESFCSRCGQALRRGGPVAGARIDHELQLDLGPSTESDQSSAGSDAVPSETGQPTWMPMLGLFLAAALVGLLGWSLLSDGDEAEVPASATVDGAESTEPEMPDPPGGLATPIAIAPANPTAAALVQAPLRPELQFPPERRAALDAMYGTTSIEQLNAGEGELVVVFSGGAFLVDIESGEAELSISWSAEPEGDVLITDHGIVWVSETEGSRFYRWGTNDPVGLDLAAPRLGSSLGEWIITFDAGHEYDANPVVTNLITLESRPVRVPFQPGTDIGLLADGSVVTELGGRVFASGSLVAGSIGGELLPSSGTSVVLTTCAGLPGSCDTRLFDRTDVRLFERAEQEVRTLYSSDMVGVSTWLDRVGGVAYWSADVAQLVEGDAEAAYRDADALGGGTDDPAPPNHDLIIRKEAEGDIARFSRTVTGLTMGQLHWTPNGLGLFHMPDGGGSLNFVDIRRGEATELRGGNGVLAVAVLPADELASPVVRQPVAIGG